MRYASETDGVLVPQTGRRECELDHRHFPEIVRGRPRPSILPGMPPRSDGFIPPCIPTRAYRVPSAPGWVHEVKHDGYRLQVRRVGRLSTTPFAMTSSRDPSSFTAHRWSFAARNSACGQILVWSTGLRQPGACQIRREREPRSCRP
jgi:hypothetical protein